MQETKKKSKLGFLIKLIIFIVLIISITNTTYVVKENEYAYVTRFSKFIKIQDTAGLHFKLPLLDKIETIPQYRMMYDIPPSEVLTGDKKTLVVDNFAVWQIDDPYTFMRTVSRITEMENRIDAVVYNAVKNTLGTMDQTTIINSDNRSIDDVNTKITEMVNVQLKNYGVSTVAVEIKRLDLPNDNESAVYNRMISERTQMAESFRAEGNLEASKVVNETDKEVGILLSKASATAEELKGEGESEYMKIIAEAYSTEDRVDYYEFIRSLEALKVTMKGEKTLILPADNYIVKILNGK
ncbi:MAG: protease modulator HflC [Tissierellia bacterium]|jgi:membrane protease subunit HflC|nr:protease modulator HflC [Tissierellia bacterium]MDD3226999.1 protease modulator HflC [Tissierellia bacterium]MDD3751027.1 protease modulator HflC [Tissierellia bacterium]MDD4045651.1 protease modulator HflC [Tissierellia bacterium]